MAIWTTKKAYSAFHFVKTVSGDSRPLFQFNESLQTDSEQMKIWALKAEGVRCEVKTNKKGTEYHHFIREGQNFTGRLKSITYEEFTFTDKNGKEQDGMGVKFFIVDHKDNEAYLLSLSMGSICRELLNKLAWIEKFGELRFGMWKNDAWYDSLSLKNDWEKVSWLLSGEEIKALITTVGTGKKQVKIFEDLDKKLLDLVDGINENAQKTFEDGVLNAVVGETTMDDVEAEPKSEGIAPEDDDDLPF